MSEAEVFHASGLEPPRAQVFSWSLPLHHHLLATERFVTILPLSMLRLGNHLPFKVLPVELPMKLRSRPTGIITLKNRMLGPVAQLFIDCARKTANALAKAY
jgi:DNA-binding transcriptional LysR family regulator